MNEQKKQPSDEEVQDNFRDALKDVLTIVEKLSPHCHTLDDLISVAKLAVEDDSQLRLLMSLTTQTKK